MQNIPLSRPPSSIGAGLLLLLLLSVTARAGAESPINDLGIRLGITDGKNEENFTLVEVFARGELPWNRALGDRWRLNSYLEAGLGALDGGAKTGLIASFGPLVALIRANGDLRLELGVKPTWLSEDRFGREDLGGHFHFTSHFAVSYRVGPGLRIGYRLQHTSNAGITDPNPGLDVHLLSIDWTF